MEAPKTYNCNICGAGFTGKDANGDINPDTIQSAVNTFKTALEDSIRGIVTSLEGVETDVGDSVRVQETTLVPQVEQVCSNIKSIVSDISSALDAASLYEKAVIVHDNLQVGYNNEAAAAASACAASHPTQQPNS